MRKFLLSTIALMMSFTMAFAGDGTSKANAIDFDWADGHKPALSAGSWYRVSLDRLKAEANNPTLALYLTNLTDETANVTVKVEATISMYGKSETGTKTLNYSIDGKAHQLWSVSAFSFQGREFSLKQMMDFGLSEVYLQLTSNQEIALSAKVYETEDIVDDACTNAIDFEWSGVSVPAGEQWYYLNLTEVDNNKQLKFIVENNGATEATVNFDLSLDCPASAIVIDKEWTIAAGAKEEDEFGRIFLNVLKEDFVYLKLHTDQPITLRVEEVVVEVEPGKYDDFDYNAATLLAFDTDLNLTAGKHVYKVKRADLIAGRDHATEFYVTNNTATPANLTVEVALSTPIESTIDQKLVIDAHSTVVKPVKDNVLKAFDVEWVYIRFITDQDLTATVGMRETSPCATAKEFDWTTGASLNAGETQWYRMDITSLKQNKQHAELSFTNHSSEVALVSVDVAFECDGKVIPLTLPIPGNLSVPGDKLPMSLVLDYQLLLRSPKDHIYLGISTDSHIELKSSVKDAIAADPTPCENALNPEHGQVYSHEAGATKWYKLSLDLLKSNEEYSSLYLANKSGKKAYVTIGLVHDCQYTPGMRLTIPVPAGFEVGALTPNLLGRLVDALSRFEGTYNKVDSKDMYLEVHSDQELEFGLDVHNAATHPCLRDDLKPFDWTTGAKVEAGKPVWYDMDITTIKNDGKHVKLTFTNHSKELVWAATVVSVNCPAELTVPMIVPVPAGVSVDHVIDYSIFAAADVDHLYVGVKADGALELAAEKIDADASDSNEADCNAATLVESGKTYTHKAGAHWYKFQMSLLDNMGDAARVTFKNNGEKTAKLSAGVTVDCQYGIVNRVPVKVPHGVDMSLSVPARVINKVREWIDADVASFYLQLNSDQDLTFGVNMDAVDVDACKSAVDFDWQNWETNGLQIQANKEVWYKVNLDYPLEKLEKGEDIVVSLSNLKNDMDVEVEIAVSPTCPALLSLEKFLSIPANEKLTKSFAYKEVMALLEHYNKYIYNSDASELLGKYDTFVFFNKLTAHLGRYDKYVPLGQIQAFLDRYGAHLTFTGIKEMIDNYEKYVSYDELKEQLNAQRDYVSVDQVLGLLHKYGKYIPVVDVEKILNDYEEYLPYAGVMLNNMKKYISKDDLKKVVEYCKQFVPFDELKQYFNRLKEYLPEDNTCYVLVKSKGDLVVDPEPPIVTPEGCDAAVELDYNKTYNLSELPTGWYKVGLDGIHAAQKNLELKLNNDLGEDTTVSISAYKSCDDLKPMATRARRLKVGPHVESIPYALIQHYASGIDTLYLYLETGVRLCGTLSCESAVPFPWNTTVAVDKEVWYKISADDIFTADSVAMTIKNTTDVTISVSVEAGAGCPIVDLVSKDPVNLTPDEAIEYKKAVAENIEDVKYDMEMTLGVFPENEDTIYVHICPSGKLELTSLLTKVQEDICYEYDTIRNTICDGKTFVDPKTDKPHTISSLVETSLTWNDTIATGEKCDSIYTYIFTPILAPEKMTLELLAQIEGATPKLVAGEAVDVTGTVEAIKAYYDANTPENVAVVESVEWIAGADVVLAANATEHPMTLKVVAGCEFEHDTTLVFPVAPAVVDGMVGVVKRALQNGENTIVLTHEADGTAHIYNVVGGVVAELSQEGVIARDPENAGDYLALSDIALTEDGKLVGVNYMMCQSGDDNVDAGYKRGENRFYIWENLDADPTLWFTSKMSSNWFRSKQGYTMALKGTSQNAEIFTTGVHGQNGRTRFSWFHVIDGVFEEPAVNNNDYYHFHNGPDDIHASGNSLEAKVGAQYELNASPLAAANWIMDGNLVEPYEYVLPATNNVALTEGEALALDLGKKFNGATYVTLGAQVLAVAPYANVEGKLAGVKVLDITAGLAAATEVAVLDLDAAVDATGAATAVKVVDGGLVINLVADATIYTLTWKPLAMVGVVKRALQNGENTIVLTHEADGTAHIYQVVNGAVVAELSQEGVVARDPENAGDLLAISDIALTEDGKLVATNYMITQSDDDQVAAGDKRGENRIYMWDNLAGDPTVLFTSKMSSNWFQSKQGLTIAVKGTSDNMEIFMTGIHKSKAWARVSSYRVIDGVYTEPDVNHNDHYFFYDVADAVALETTAGTQYELTASPLGTMNWILDAELIDPVEIVEPDTNNVEISSCVALLQDLGKKYQGTSIVTYGAQVLMVAPYANAESKLAGIKVLDITAGLAAATEVAVLDLDAAVEATAAATAVAVNTAEHKLAVTLVADATIYTFEVALSPVIRPEGNVIVETICYDDEYPWNGVTYSIANGNLVVGVNPDIVYPENAAPDVQVDTLRLTVLPNVVYEAADSATVCFGGTYNWRGAERSASASDTVRNSLGCDSIIYTLQLTVLPDVVYEEADKATVCFGGTYNWRGAERSASASDTVRNSLGCDSIIYTLQLTILPEVEDVVEYDTICPGETITWNGVTYATAGEHTLTLQNENGCEYTATLHLHIPDPENFEDYRNIPALSKYGSRLLVVDLSTINSTFGWTPAEEDVRWFKVEGEVDNAFDAVNGLGNDEQVGTGYYYTLEDGSVLPDSYYALIVHEMVSGECQEILRTIVLSSNVTSSAPLLVPTIANPSAELRILNLNPSNVTEVRVFNTSGELVEQYTASQATEFVFKAATMQGYYMVEVQSENDKVTLRYIVK